MPNFVVRVPEIHIVEICVEAVNLQEAKKKANAMIEDGSDVPEAVYSHTSDTDEWTVQVEE